MFLKIQKCPLTISSEDYESPLVHKIFWRTPLWWRNRVRPGTQHWQVLPEPQLEPNQMYSCSRTWEPFVLKTKFINIKFVWIVRMCQNISSTLMVYNSPFKDIKSNNNWKWESLMISLQISKEEFTKSIHQKKIVIYNLYSKIYKIHELLILIDKIFQLNDLKRFLVCLLHWEIWMQGLF